LRDVILFPAMRNLPGDSPDDSETNE